MEAYLDNSATTQCFEEVRDIVVKTMMEDYGKSVCNAQKRRGSRTVCKRCDRKNCKNFKSSGKEIYFTSGGTESDNWALVGCAYANRRQGKHIISTVFEHAAVSAPLAALEEQGFEITKISG